MYSIDFAGMSAPFETWVRDDIRRRLHDAQEHLDEAAQQLRSLLGIVEWSSEGMRALNQLMQRFADRLSSEIEHVRARIAELERMRNI